MESTAYWLGDVPAQPLVLVPTRDGEPIALSLYDEASAVLVSPAGLIDIATATIETDETTGEQDLLVTLPTLGHVGLSSLRVTLTGANGVRNRIDAVPIIVQDDDGWHTLPSARAEWADSSILDDRRLWTLLEIAKTEVLAYAPALPADAAIPLNYREAQLMHARNRLNAARVDPSGSAGADSFTLAPFPLDWTIKQTLRPQRGLKAVR